MAMSYSTLVINSLVRLYIAIIYCCMSSDFSVKFLTIAYLLKSTVGGGPCIILMVQSVKSWNIKFRLPEIGWQLLGHLLLKCALTGWKQKWRQPDVVQSIAHKAFNDLWPVRSWINFSGTSPWYISVAAVARRLWFVLWPDIPAFSHMSFSLLPKARFPTGTEVYHGPASDSDLTFSSGRQ